MRYSLVCLVSFLKIFLKLTIVIRFLHYILFLMYICHVFSVLCIVHLHLLCTASANIIDFLKTTWITWHNLDKNRDGNIQCCRQSVKAQQRPIRWLNGCYWRRNNNIRSIVADVSQTIICHRVVNTKHLSESLPEHIPHSAIHNQCCQWHLCLKTNQRHSFSQSLIWIIYLVNHTNVLQFRPVPKNQTFWEQTLFYRKLL